MASRRRTIAVEKSCNLVRVMPLTKRIGVFEAGPVPDEITDHYPNYAQMIINWLQPALPDVEFKAYSPLRGEALPAIDACDGYIYSGSRHGAYDDIDWIAPLEQFIRDLDAARIPQFGICFGHQIMAQALGGKVVKSDRGWGCGIQHYTIHCDSLTSLRQAARERDGIDPDQDETLQVLLMHQDQVVELPATAKSIGGNDFCPYGVIRYEGPALSVQFHPEFSNVYVDDLLRLRGGTVIDQNAADAGKASLTVIPDNPIIADWVAGFFQEQWT